MCAGEKHTIFVLSNFSPFFSSRSSNFLNPHKKHKTKQNTKNKHKDNGSVLGLGSNQEGQLGYSYPVITPILVDYVNNVVDVALGAFFSLLLLGPQFLKKKITS